MLVFLACVWTATAPVLLGRAGEFTILSKAGISTVPSSVITGDIGVSPIDATGLTGFDLTAGVGTVDSTSTQVVGLCFAADYTSPTPSMLTTAISNMETAYTDAAGRTPTNASFTNVGAGQVTGMTFTAGVYEWGGDVHFTGTGDGITISGSASDVFIFKTSNDIIVGNGAHVILAGGALSSNIFWQVAGFVDAGTTSHLEGIFLVKTRAMFKTGSSLNGRIFAQTAVTLDTATITAPSSPPPSAPSPPALPPFPPGLAPKPPPSAPPTLPPPPPVPRRPPRSPSSPKSPPPAPASPPESPPGGTCM